MKKFNKTKAVKKPINVLNIFLVLAVLSVIVGFLIMFLNDIYSFDGRETLDIDKFEMKLSIKNIVNDEISALNEGDRLVVKDANTVLGTLTEIETDEERDVTVLYLNVVGTHTSDKGFKLNGKTNMALGDLIELEGINKAAEIISIHAMK